MGWWHSWQNGWRRKMARPLSELIDDVKELIKYHFRRSHCRPDASCAVTFVVFLEKDGQLYKVGEECVLGSEHECLGYKFIFDLLKQGYEIVAVYSVREWWWFRREYSPEGADVDWYGRPYIEIAYYGYDEICDFVKKRVRARLRYSYSEYGEEKLHGESNWHLFKELESKHPEPIERYYAGG